MGSLSARVDTVPPQIEGSLSGTPGEAGWYVSPVTFTASASDLQPGSGIETFSYSLDGGEWTAYVAPIIVSDGLHTVTFRAQDLAGHVSEISQSVQVDTIAPQVDASLTGEQANGWYLSRVTFTASASDDGSGLARIEYALDGASWQAYTAPVTVGDGMHILRVRALDVAGNQAEMAPLSFQVDGRSPQIRLTPSWYLWERGEVQVRDGESGLVGVEVEIRDPQGRWPKVVRSYEAIGASFATGIEWDRRFADGTLAPIGSYEVVVKAWDRAGNFARQTASIHIPAPNAPTRRVEPAETYTPAPAPTALSVMAEVSSPTPVPLQLAMETALPTPTVLVSGFRTVATPPVESQSRTSPTGSGQSPVLWGMAALGAIGVATAYALERRRRRREEEARQAAEAAAEAARRNAAEAARRVQNWLQGQAMLQNALNNSALSDAEKRTVQQQAQTKGIGAALGLLGGLAQAAWERYRAMDAKIEREEQKEEAAWEAWKSRSQTLAAQRAEQQRQQAATAYQAYRQGERAEAQPVAQTQKPWWQRAGEWLQDKVEKFVYHPPSWLSVSYSSGEFSPGNYTAAHWISYQPSARNFWESISYQQVSVELKTKGTLTTNPKGIVDVDLSDGTITFNTGPNSSFFIQPSALSIGWKSSSPPPGNVTPPNPDVQIASINQTVIDVDLFGKNMLSFKVSYATGMERSQVFNVNGTDVRKTSETDLDVTINVHRWPRIVMAAAALYFVFEAGAAAIAPRAIPWMVEKVPALAPLFVGP